MEIDKSLELLIKLQKTDNEISRFNELLESIPSEIGSLSESLDAAKEELRRFHDRAEESNKLRLAKEREVEDKTSAIAKSKGKLNDVKTNEEYKAVLKEIDNMQNAISSLEDEQLALMEELEGNKENEKQFGQKVEQEGANFKRLKAEKETEIEGIKKEKETVEAVKKEMASQLAKNLLAQYDKTLSMRERKAVVEMKDGYCSACHQTVMPQVALEIRTRAAIHTCQYCDRFLYVAKDGESGNNKKREEGGQTAAGALSGPEESPDTEEQGTP